jgi:xylose dehydrogenase (NAD/NADP)
MAYRAAIVGAGNISSRHARACREVADVDLVAICDVRPEAARKLAADFQVDACYSTVDELVANERLDITILATQGETHAELARALARSGRVRAILCEKPITTTAAAATTMFQEAAAHGVLLAEAFKFRHHPMHLKIEELISRGRLGRVSHVHSTFMSYKQPDVYRSGKWQFDPKHGGGAILDIGCYTIHHALFVMGAEPELVQAIGWWGERTGVEDHVVANLAFPGGRSAQWVLSWGVASSQSLEIYGSEGTIRIPRAPWNNEDQAMSFDLVDARGNRELYEFAPVYQFSLQLQHLCDCLTTGQPHRVPASQSIGGMRVMDAAFESMRSKTPVRVGA